MQGGESIVWNTLVWKAEERLYGRIRRELTGEFLDLQKGARIRYPPKSKKRLFLRNFDFSAGRRDSSIAKRRKDKVPPLNPKNDYFCGISTFRHSEPPGGPAEGGVRPCRHHPFLTRRIHKMHGQDRATKAYRSRGSCCQRIWDTMRMCSIVPR